MEKNTHASDNILMLLTVEFACFNKEKKGTFYVKVFIEGEGPIKRKALVTLSSKNIKYSNNVIWGTNRWVITIDPTERVNSLRFEVYKARKFFSDSLIGMTTYKLKTRLKSSDQLRSEEEKSLIPCENNKNTSLKICKNKASTGELNVNVVLREKVAIKDAAQDYFVLKQEDFRFPKH
ncbi:hypothetical protein R3W88_006291 [Solanum pinnatisectum]|uniref:Uncharacterized protein n=1 Tax=Solanum pinnatisectum TaxID=50273 RepID=A0AAV9KFZ5_9SOLN|nr:hypothetical protein R3W88_006291 [Solanum pinnatisectum]